MKIKIIDKFSKKDLDLLKDINVIIEDREYDCDEIYNISDLTVDKEIELINAEKEGEYNSLADRYGTLTSYLIRLGNDLYEGNFIKVFNSETNSYIAKKIVGKYKYLGGECIPDLTIGKTYIRVEPKNEFRIVDDTGEDYLYMPSNFEIIEEKINKIELIHGSSAEQKVDALVNSANKMLMSGGGICGVLFKKAGYEELNEACKKYNLPLKDGDAVITPAFNIKNAQYIIHAVAPNFNTTPKAYKELFYAYYNSLKVLKENNLHSISFPLISSGIFGGNLKNPVDVSVKECIYAYKKFIDENIDYYVRVKLCAFSSNEYDIAKSTFEKHY